MQTGRLPGNRDGEMVLASEDEPFEVKLDLQERSIGQLLAELSHLHSDQRCSCPAQHRQTNLSDPAVAAFVKRPLNGGRKQVDLRKCAFWLASSTADRPAPEIMNNLSEQNEALYLPEGEVICIIARAGDPPKIQQTIPRNACLLFFCGKPYFLASSKLKFVLRIVSEDPIAFIKYKLLMNSCI